MLLEAAITALGRTPRQLAVRNISPLFADAPVTLAGTAIAADTAQAWASGPAGQAVLAELRFDAGSMT